MDRETELESALIGGLERETIVVEDYDEEWPRKASAWMRRITDTLGQVALSVAHIGSTAVPGLAAKPIIDLLLIVADVEAEDVYVDALAPLGLTLRVREPGHRMRRTPDRDVHLHVLPPNTDAEHDYLALRDWLRVSADDRDRYAATKRHLAERSWDDMNFYADAKSDTVREILTRARAWRSGGALG